MNAAQALADLTEISSQVQAAVLFDADGNVAASTLEDERSRELVDSANRLLQAADDVRRDEGASLTQLEAATTAGSVFVVREDDLRIVATTAPDPTIGLVFYDLKSALRSARSDPEQPEKAKRTRRPKTEDRAS